MFVIALLALFASPVSATTYAYVEPPKVTLYSNDGTPALSLGVCDCDYDCLSAQRFNDKIVAVDIPNGLAVTMCADPGFRTYCQTFTSSTKYISVGDGVSSLKVFVFQTPPVVIPTPPVVIPTKPTGGFGDCSWYEPYRTCMGKKSYTSAQCYGHYSSFCSRGHYRHLTAEANTRSLAEDHGKCMANDYEMFLVMQGAHMTGLATPVEADSDCPNLVFHSDVAIDGEMSKSVFTIEEEGVDLISEDEKLHLGTQSLVNIVSAFEKADVSKGDKAYDAVTNNCVVLLRNMADPLDIPVDQRMIKFVSKRLLAESGAHIVGMLKQSPSLSAVFGSGGRFLKGMGAEEIVAKVIELYV